MDKKIGFIGCGNMGKAILGGMIASGQVLQQQRKFITGQTEQAVGLADLQRDPGGKLA